MITFTTEADGITWVDIATQPQLLAFKEIYAKYGNPSVFVDRLQEAPCCVALSISPLFFPNIAIREMKAALADRGMYSGEI